ncbi:neocarzinostatin apoprotein domain-containing protein [Nocardioides zeae]|uniref:Neocarzinostatin family protein n=1 Tax=Nocardioides zeae TaxID=1457234 RepID=A0AAJ1X1V3_9ACTN|nr:neocarzinostatin apoprotein domain-containing protein [Nocardioides zeae]MDQ1105968.1 hypothetical protein [Nocardioides zeae]
MRPSPRPTPSPRAHVRRGALLAGAAGLAVGAALLAAPAQAATVVATTPTTGLATSDTVTVTVTFDPATEARYSIAQCDKNDVPLGRSCKAAGAVSTTVPASGTVTRTLAVEQLFTNTSFVPGLSPSSPDTDCGSIGPDDCVLVVQTYTAAYVPVSTTYVDLAF